MALASAARPLAARRYFWKRLVGLSGIVRSINPAEREAELGRSDTLAADSRNCYYGHDREKGGWPRMTMNKQHN